MKIKLIKKIEILGSVMDVKYLNDGDYGSFSLSENLITIGIKSIEKDPIYTLSIISHEVMEAIMCYKGMRFENDRTKDNFLFNFSHQEFENMVQLHTMALTKFLK
jgi:hypothetical protein